MQAGKGSHTYEVDHSWAKLPAGKAFGYTHGVGVDKNDRVYIFNQSEDALCVFERDGTFVTSWGREYAAGAHGLFYAVEGGTEYLYLSDYELKKVAKHTLDGRQVLEFKMPPRQDIYLGNPYKPTDVCVAANGDVYIFDGYGMPYVHCYDKNANFKFSIGGPGKGEGQLNCPHAGNINTRGGEEELYVADRGNSRIQVFTLDGKHKRFVTEEQNQPCNFAWYEDEVYIPDLISRLTILDKNDKLIAHVGHDPEAAKTPGWPNIPEKVKPGQFSSPHQCRVDRHGDVYVVEWISTGRVTKLTRKR